MKYRAVVALQVAFSILSVANAQTWTSPDGFLSVTVPDPAKFAAFPEPPPPFLALWVSTDESMKFGVMKTELPTSAKLIQLSVEEGLAHEIGGQVTRLPTKTIAGHEVWCMMAKGASFSIVQAVIQQGDVAYKVMAVMVGVANETATVNEFIDSLSISESSTRRQNDPIQIPDGTLDLHNLSKAIGGASALLLIGFVVYLFSRRQKNPKEPIGD